MIEGLNKEHKRQWSQALTIYVFIFLLSVPLILQAVEFNEKILVDDIKLNYYLDQVDQLRRADITAFREHIDELIKHPNSKDFKLNQLIQLQEAYYAAMQGNYPKAFELTDRLSVSEQQVIRLRALTLAVNMSAFDRKWSKGIQHIYTLENLLPAISSRSQLNRIYSVLAIFYLRLGEHQEALDYANKELKYSGEYDKCSAYSHIILAQFESEILTFSNNLVQQGLQACENVKDELSYLLTVELIARSLINIDDKSALDRLLLNLERIKSINYPLLTANTYATLSALYGNMNKVIEAASYANMAFETGKHLSNTETLARIHKLISQSESRKGNSDQALYHFKEYSRINALVLDETKVKAIAYQSAQLNKLHQQNKIDQLTHSNLLLQANEKLAQARSEKFTIIVGALLSIVSILVFALYRIRKAQKELKHLSYFDHLTGIYNRRRLLQLGNKLLKSCENNSLNIVCVMFDIDHFKKINDQYSHATGDWALVEVCKVITACLRNEDVFARIGGEEFIVLLPNTDQKTAESVVHSMMYRLSKINTQPTSKEFTITASFGIATSDSSGYELDKLMDNADKAVYLSKTGGRNLYTHYSIMTEKKYAKSNELYGLS